MFASRVTIDIDGYVPAMRLKALRAWHMLACADERAVAVSSGGQGLHIEGRFDDPLTDAQKERLRRELHDDPARTRMDIERMACGHTGNVFWYEKGGNDGERQSFPTLEDALQYIEMTRRSDYRHAKALANRGHRAVQAAHQPRL